MRSLKERMLEEIEDIRNLAAQYRYRIQQYYPRPRTRDFESLASHLKRLRGCANMKHKLGHTWVHRYSQTERKRINKEEN